MTKYLIIISLISTWFVTAPSYGKTKDSIRYDRIDQDSLWNPLYNILRLDNELFKKRDLLTKDELNVLHEHYLRELRDKGLSYWNTSTDTSQRLEWLILTLTIPPNYYNYSNGKFDVIEKEKWNSTYLSLRKEFLSSIDDSPRKARNSLRHRLGIAELYGAIESDKFSFQVTSEKIDLDNYVAPIIRLVNEANSDSLSVLLTVKQTADMIFNNYKNLGLNEKEILSFLNRLENKEMPQLSQWLQGKKKMLDLKANPYSLIFQTYDNKPIDIGQMNGKVILIDFWATWCSVCLDYMPTIKRVFEKYHSRGLEVLSLSINKNSERQQVLSVEKKMNVSWPLGIIGDEKLKKDVWEKFGFTSVPQLLLLDKNGKLIEINGKLMNAGGLDELVRKALE